MTGTPALPPLVGEHVVAYSYRRSVGGATGEFLAGLARAQILGARLGDGRVVVPPTDDGDIVPVSDTGVVRSWTWVAEPGQDHPLPHPFGLALIQLDGADTSLLHVVDVGDEARMATGMRVYADWRNARTGSIHDIRAFVAAPPQAAAATVEPPEQIEVVTDLRLDFAYHPGVTLSHFLRALGEHRVEGGRCPGCGQVYVPPRPRCPACGRAPMAPVALDDRGTIVSYTVVHVPPPGEPVELPFAWAWIRLDGSDVPFPHLLGDVEMDAIHVGQRVQAVWVSDDELAPTWASIRHFGPLTT